MKFKPHHGFFIAKLLPRLPFFESNSHGQKVLPSLTTKPFLALHIQPSKPYHPHRHGLRPDLFVITSQPPTSPGSEYLVLNQPRFTIGERTLNVVPPLPFDHPLYLHITPRIGCGGFGDTSVLHINLSRYWKNLAKSGKYQLDYASLSRFLEALRQARPSIPGIRGDSDKPIPSNWDTWTAPATFDMPDHFIDPDNITFYFDLVPFDSPTKDLDLAFRIYDDLAITRQLTVDYTWERSPSIIRYIDVMRKNLPRFQTSHHLPVLFPHRPNSQIDALHPCTSHLQSLPSFIDNGDPPPERNEKIIEWADDWMNGPEESVLYIPNWVAVPLVKAKDIKVIVFDFDVLIDRDGPLQEALVHIFPPSQHQFSSKELLDCYVEHEALRAIDGGLSCPIATIKDVARYLSISVDEYTITTALDSTRVENPSLYPEASNIISALVEKGYTVLGLPSSSSNYSDLLSQLRGLSLLPRSSILSSSNWDLLVGNHPGLQWNQVLIVTGNACNTAEPASKEGFPTALINCVGSRSANASLPNAQPTVKFTSLSDLLEAVLTQRIYSMPLPERPDIDSWPRWRIRNCYQVTTLLARGSSFFVYGGMQVHTGAGVAMKFEKIPGTKLQYEAAALAQLRGVPGVPRLHWNGTAEDKGDTYVLVMDLLGPNLEQLRKFCRGRFELRTVLMLGEQMLSTIEAIHSRGIIMRDIKPDNFAMGFQDKYRQLYTFDLGLSRLWLDPSTGEHMPFRENRNMIGVKGYLAWKMTGTPRYASPNVHFGKEASRRDDIEAIGFVLLYLFHGRLPWQGVCAPDVPSKLRLMGEMKSGKVFTDFLTRSATPKCFIQFFEHCRSLAFEDQPDYTMLRKLLREEFESRGWGEYDWKYDWDTGNGERGTLLAEEYRLDIRLVEPLTKRRKLL